MKLVERIKICARCELPKPWSEFHSKVKWPDGTTRQPHSRCKVCMSLARVPTRKRDWAALIADPEEHAIQRDRRRVRWRTKHGVESRHHRLRLEADSHVTLLDAVPLASWLIEVVARDSTSIRATAQRLGIAERMFRRILNGQKVVELATVERALIADDTVTLRDLYETWYEEAA